MAARADRPKPDAHAPPEAGFSFGAQPWNASGPLAAQAARGALMGLDAIEAALKSWRGLIDASRTMIREQQDIALRTWRTQLAEAVGAEQTAQASAEQGFLWPMQTAMKSYEQMTDAVLQAQRNALEAFSDPTALH